MSDQEQKYVSGKSSKLRVFWVFGLGFFAGFLVSLVVADKIKGIGSGKTASTEAPPQPVEPEISQGPSIPVEPSVQKEEHVDLQQDVVMTKEMRDRLLTFDFLKLLQDAEISRYRNQGEMRGIVLNKIRTGSVYEKIGFKNGDIIQSINGFALADIDRHKKEMTEKLPGAANIEFKIRRDDKIQKIRVKIADPGQ